MVADPGVARWRARAEIYQSNAGRGFRERPRQHGKACAERAKPRLNLAIVAPADDLSARKRLHNPADVRHAAKGRVHKDQWAAFAIAEGGGRMSRRGIEPVGGGHQLAGNHLRLVEGSDAHDEIRLPPRQAIEARISQQFHRHIGVEPAELRQNRAKHGRSEPIGTGEAQQAVKPFHAARQLTLHGKGFVFHPQSMGIERLALVGQDEAVAGALKKRGTSRLFERAQAPPHGGLGLLEPTGGRSQRAFPGNGEKDREIAPLEIVHLTSHTKMHAFRAILMIAMQAC